MCGDMQEIGGDPQEDEDESGREWTGGGERRCEAGNDRENTLCAAVASGPALCRIKSARGGSIVCLECANDVGSGCGVVQMPDSRMAVTTKAAV